MDAERWHRIEALFEQAIALPECDRGGFLATACGSDLQLNSELDALLTNATTACGSLQAAVVAEVKRLAGDAALSHVGRRIGPFRLTRKIGEGGMGAVYLAERDDAQFAHRVAIKILTHAIGSSEAVARFRDERQILAALEHPHIVRLLDGGNTDDDLPYLVMEYIEGQPIHGYAEQHALSVRARIELIRQVCGALQYAHQNLVVHRDIKPSNILVDAAGTPKILDFGIAKALGSESKDEGGTQRGTLKGKFAYMAPEQLTGTEVDRRVDIFALGVVIGEMVTMRRLFQRKTDYLTFRAVMEQPLPDFRRHRPDLPEAMVEVLTRALARDPAERYRTVRELAIAVTDALGRPWSQAEIGALVRTDFSDELRRHHDQVADVVSRGALLTKPVILENPSDPDAEDYFAFETSIENGWIQGSQVTGADASTADAVSRPHRQPARRWRPIAAIGAASVAAVILGVIAIQALRSPSSPDAPTARTAQPTEPGQPVAVAVAPRTDPYGAAIHARDAELTRCATLHDEPLPEGTRAVVRIGAAGRAVSVSFTPAPAARSALASCLRDVLAATVYPTTEVEQELALAVRR
jgi:serine/threonine protein kinase